uniref:serine/threonine-protein kinase par-1-like n=1 Tax=Epinephelus lanceolatus TaxID=310571 RepID=UPI001447593B|nr:serine/threonine-protein kinase par-1-like [Epinephelus lanceolatus]
MDVAKLNEYTQKERLALKYEDVGCVGPDHIKTFTVRAVVNGKAYPDGVGKNKKEAKQNAAKNALRSLLGEPDDSVCKSPEPGEEKHSGVSSKQEEELSQNVSDICDKTKSLSVITSDEGFAETNFIGLINSHCQRNNLPHDYILEKRCGPPHNPQFFYKLVINNKDYPVGEGKNVKEAKQNAAQLALCALQQQKDWDSKGSSCPADDSAPARLSMPPNTPGSHNAKSKRVPATTSDSVVPTSSSNPPKDQIQSPDVKPRRRIAANFQNAHKKSKENIADFNGKKTGNSPSKKTTTQTVSSRFTAEFDSIVCLGKGAFGRVYKAKQKLLKKDYAIKIVRCKEIKKALREAMALSDLHHRNIVRYYTCWLEDSEYQWDTADDSGSTSQSTGNTPVNYLYIQMELCDTKTLRVWIDEKNILNVKKSLRDSKRRDESLSIIQEIVSAVEYFHSKMLIHRDLKPANIMFGQEGEVKIGDFGLVTDENDGDAENVIERTVYKGTPSYMAPEQKSKNTYDRKVDIFALGLIYFELLWNTGLERKAVWDDARNQKFPQVFLQYFSLESQIIKSMLCAKPDDRPEASKVKTDLEECASTLTKLKDMRRDNRTFTLYPQFYVIWTQKLTAESLKMETGNCVARLNEYVQKTRSQLHYEDLGSVGPAHSKVFTQRVVLNGKVYPNGVGMTKKEAKHNAAKNALSSMFKSAHQDSVDTTADENSHSSGRQKEELNQNVSDLCDETRSLSLNSKDNILTETNFIGLVNHYCQKTNRGHAFIEERICGPPHKRQFFYKLIIDGNEYPVGEGMSVKAAKQDAARLAWSALQDQTDWDSKVSIRSTASEGGATSMLSARSASLDSYESSSLNTSRSTSHSIIFTDSSNPSKDQMGLRSTVSENDAPARLSTPTSLESLASSQSMSTGTSSSGIQTDSSNSSKDQHAVKDRNMGNSQKDASTQSRFTADFDIIKPIGSGGFGSVFKARHKLLNKFYAVKIVRCEEKAFREVGTLSDLLHRNIVRYYTFWKEDSEYQLDISGGSSTGSYSSSQSTENSSAKYLYIQMELCDTKTLREWIKEKNSQPLQDSKRREESLRIAQQIVSGVEYIHSKRHIHRDLKPANILFGLDGEVKIGDFGLVTKDDDDDAVVDRTVDKGTPSYMAPEQMEKAYDRKVDIFALGLIYLELLWKVSSGHERGDILRNAKRQMLPKEFSLAFPQENQLIKSMLCEKPKDRPEASKLQAELEKWAQIFNSQNVRRENATY